MSVKASKYTADSETWNALENNVPIAEVAPDGKLIRANRKYLDLLGYVREDVSSLSHKDLCTIDTVVSKEYADFWRSLRNGETVTGVFQRRRKDSARLWLDAVYIPISDKSGKLVKIISFCTDATRRVQKARSNSRKLKTIDNTILCAEISPQGKVLRANPNFAATVGYAPEDLVGMDRSVLIDGPEKERTADAEFWSGLCAGHSHTGRVKRKASNGDTVWLQAVYVPITGQDGALERIAFFGTDISDMMRNELRAQEEIQGIALISECMSNAAVITDQFNKISYVNPGFTRLFGYARKEMLGRPLSALMQLPYAGGAPEFKKLQQQSGVMYTEVQVLCKSGRNLWCAMHVSGVKHAKYPSGFTIIILTDINSTKLQSSLQLKALEAISRGVSTSEVLRLICVEAESIMRDARLVISQTDRNGKFLSVLMPRHGFRAHEPKANRKLAHEKDVAEPKARLTDTTYGVTIGEIAAQAEKPHCTSIHIHSSQDSILGQITVCRADERKPDKAEKQLLQAIASLCALALERDETRAAMRSLAFYDQATGLPNRELFMAEAARLLQEKRDQPHAVMAININRYKKLLDSLGRDSMNSLLRKLAQRLMAVRLPESVSGRISDDVFAVFSSGCNAGQARERVKKIQSGLAAPLEEAGLQISPNTSIGLSICPENGSDIESLLENAALAMARAEELGPGKCSFYDPEQDNMLREAIELESELRSAIENGTLRLFYQPQVLIQEHGLHGVEALCRWNHPSLGSVSPARFIPLAEESGLMESLWRWSLNEACRQLSEWRKRGINVPSVSVNLSASSFHNPEMPGETLQTVRRHALEPSDVILELTEAVLLDDNPNTRQCISAAIGHGFRFSMDDFGTGYSSLAYLRQLPFAEIKLDKSFVRDLEGDVTSQRLSQAVAHIAKSLNLTTIAEGIETERQYQLLAQQGYDAAQGFFKARPMPAPEFADWYAGFANPARQGQSRLSAPAVQTGRTGWGKRPGSTTVN